MPFSFAGLLRILSPRPIDRDLAILTSPCDAIVGASGAIAGTELFQIKGSPYSLPELLGDGPRANAHRNGRYVTLRLTAGMYHRFHAPHDCWVEEVVYISGDTWNVNPIALKRVENLFCRNERALIRTRLAAGDEFLIRKRPEARGGFLVFIPFFAACLE